MNPTDWINRRTAAASRRIIGVVDTGDLLFVSCFAAFLAFGFVFVSEQSFWLDEVRSGAKAVQPTFAAFRAELLKTGGSDVQMPLYMFLLWLWARIFGAAEWTLRTLNLVFLASSLAIIATTRALTRTVRLCWGALCVLSPLVAFYLDEARPYLLLFLGGTLVASAMANSPERDLPEPSNVRRLLLGAVVLSAASLTGAVFAAFPCLWLILYAVRGRATGVAMRRHPAAIPAAALALVALFAYYLWTLAAGFRGTQSYSTDLRTAAFCVYEFLGASGIGPGRAALRADPVPALLANALPLCAFLVAWAAFLVAALRARPSRSFVCHPLFLCPSAGSLLLLAMGAVLRQRIVGRHLIPALPAFLLALAWSADRVWSSERRLGRVAVLSLCAAFLASSLTLRFAPRHAKDDVRSAAALAVDEAESGGVVWWGGDKWTFEYYPPPACDAAVRLILFPDEQPPAPPSLAVLSSKYDISDPSGARRALLRSLGLAPSSALPGFAFWRPIPSSPATFFRVRLSHPDLD